MPRPGRTACLASALTIALSSLAAAAPPRRQDETRPAGDKGLPVSAVAPSFLPLHVTGPHAGKAVCPRCVYGTAPQLQLWVQEEHLGEGLALARRAEPLCAARPGQDAGKAALVAYVVLVPTSGGKVTDATVAAVRAAGFQQVFFVQVPSWDDASTSRLHGHSDRDRPKVRVYCLVNGRVFQRWDSPALDRWAEIGKAVEDASQHVVSHEIADAQIAPMWEPGERLELEFLVVDAQGKPMPRAKVSAMQADASGLYNPRGWNRMTPRLTALAWTDQAGRITFRTIVPGGYPDQPEPAHVHFSVVIDGKPRFRTLWFEGDPRLTPERRKWADQDDETEIVSLDRTGRTVQARHTFVIR